MPATFASAGKGFHLTGYAVANNQETIRYGGQYPAKVNERQIATADEGYVPSGRDTVIQERYRIARTPLLAGGAITLQSRTWFCGWATGAGLPAVEQFNLGTFGGYSNTIGKLVPTASIGLFMNSISNRGDYWTNYESYGSDDRSFTKISGSYQVVDFEVPVKIGILYRMAPLAYPYATYAVNTIGFWPQDNPNVSERQITDVTFAVGLRYQGFAGMEVSIEAEYSELDIPDRYGSYHFDSKMLLSTKL
ncbi:MAG: hypothetical protein JWO30_3670 [Fibrobacteres bacterium]|nr:hypothetical protein [Fibrobacterota bacterium]